MRPTHCLVLLLTTYLLFPHFSYASDCRQLGFSETLLCSSCSDLSQFVTDGDLIKECKSCCSDETENTEQTFVSAQLVVCRCAHHINSFPHIFEFIDKNSQDYPKLTVVNERGSPPLLRLKDNTGALDTLNIEGWKTEHLEQFLKEKLI